MINKANLEATRFWPELLPSAEYVSPSAGTEANIINLTPPLPGNLLVRLSNIGAVRSADAELRFKADAETFEVPCAALKNLSEPNPYGLLAQSSCRLAVYANADLSNYQVWHNLLVFKATIAHKLVLGIPLTREERSINEELGVSKTVERGTLPIKFDRTLLYEYYPIYREVRTMRKDLPTEGIDVATIRPPGRNQFVALESISCERPPDAGYGTKLHITRDDDEDYIILNNWALDLDYDVPCFIPALRELYLSLESNTAISNYRVRYRYSVMPLTNILRVRWGLVSKEEMPELYKKVVSGVV